MKSEVESFPDEFTVPSVERLELISGLASVISQLALRNSLSENPNQITDLQRAEIEADAVYVEAAADRVMKGLGLSSMADYDRVVSETAVRLGCSHADAVQSLDIF